MVRARESILKTWENESKFVCFENYSVQRWWWCEEGPWLEWNHGVGWYTCVQRDSGTCFTLKEVIYLKIPRIYKALIMLNLVKKKKKKKQTQILLYIYHVLVPTLCVGWGYIKFGSALYMSRSSVLLISQAYKEDPRESTQLKDRSVEILSRNRKWQQTQFVRIFLPI